MVEVIPQEVLDLLLVLGAGHLRHVDGRSIPHAHDIVLEVGVDHLALLLVEERHQPAQPAAQLLETVQVDPLPEIKLLHGGQVCELGLHHGDRALLLQQHGDFHDPLAEFLEVPGVAFRVGKLHCAQL